MQGEARIRGLAGRLASALLLLAGPHAWAGGPDTDPARRLEETVQQVLASTKLSDSR